MSKGRKPKPKNVVPFIGAATANAKERAQAAAQELKPANLTEAVAAEWDAVAPILAAPHVDRLKAEYVPAVVEMCHLLARLRAIRAKFPTLDHETYETKGRNGTQIKIEPMVAQMNDTQRQLRGYFAAFGMTPADARNLAPGQGNLFDDPSAEYF